MNILELYQKFIECNQEISTDTRSLIPGSLFFTWNGESCDGNTFAAEALEKGARYVVIDNPQYFIDERTIVVENSVETLQELARYHRKEFDIPVIAIGGSNGKTTTKEILAGILGTQKDTVASFASLNNHIGVPKTLLRINKLTDIVIIEMGANHVGEINTLCKIAEPTHGLITNIGRDHIGLFGGQAAIVEANIELYNYLENNNGYVFVNKNDKILPQYATNPRQTGYGTGLTGESGVTSKNTVPLVSLSWKHYSIQSKLTGEYNIENINASITVGVHFGITDDHIISAVESYTPTNNRSEIVETEKGNILIKDFYNANRTSMELALQNLVDVSKKYPEKEIIAILGDMLELGEFSNEEHQAVVHFAQSLEIRKIILVGPDFSKTYHEGSISYNDIDKVISALQETLMGNSVILLKASNGTNFQKLFNDVDW